MLPELETSADAEIHSDNVLAFQAIYVAHHLDELRMFQVGQRLVELFQQGALPLGKRRAGTLKHFATVGQAGAALERKRLFEQALGLPRGDTGQPEVNRDFITLWLRFILSASTFVRQRDVAALLRPAARALAANASAHGAALAPAARQLSAEVKALRSLLRAPEVCSAFGARDMWQVIDHVNRQYLGGAVNVYRSRTQAQSGATVLKWLAAHAASLAGPAPGADLLVGRAGLARAARQWLAASAMQSDDTAAPFNVQALAQDLVQALARGTGGTDGANSGPVVFCGAPGSGRTLAAHVLAAALSRDLQRVDRSQWLGKYAGETEKNLEQLLARAERADAVLLFDEADALFGKRTEVKDAHDRYANLDAARLLQRIEAHKGLVVLECKTAPAKGVFAARQRVVRFPRPGQPLR